ncbi:lipopolysaccharide biosynthesis protein [Mangrovibacterium diazotrophicum]|uniref:Na+-driven multidrug efflux pump n=1 Tax=Mangrovibacterium diazotrophicum TaxID=1261403 RepID=A0A419W963_9BACT|nr:MATE family efflux transporter [Mangrovibacterium diazotrophicum]RKD91980.1 Na+-driven multidrug efflux pump [Mangrovibacterium diazotrophicum]
MSGNLKKSVVNTGFMYGKMVVSMVTTFVGTRIVLEQLGAEDFGLYNLIAGITAMLGFFRSSLSTSNQRYLSLALGAEDNKRLQEVFNSSKVLHLVLSISLIVALEVVGIYLIYYKLDIPPNSTELALIIFQFLIFDIAFSITSIPYSALISSHEDIHVIAILYTLDAIGKFAVALLLIFIQSNQLIVYAAGLTVTFTLSRMALQLYCKHKYKNLSYKFVFRGNKGLMKEIFFFTGYSSFGAISDLVRTQGIGVVLNLFFGVLINAAYALVLQINGQLRFFASSLMMTLNPQIIKAEGSGDRVKMLELALQSTKFSFFILSFVSIPIYWQLPNILDIWLKDVPKYTLELARLIIIQALIYQLTSGIHTAINSIGNIKKYQIISSFIYLMTLPLGYFTLKAGYGVSSILYISIAIEIIVFCFRIQYLNKLSHFPIVDFLKKTFRYTLLPVITATIIIIGFYKSISELNQYLAITVAFVISSLTSITSIYFIGLGKDEQSLLIKQFNLFYAKYTGI